MHKTMFHFLVYLRGKQTTFLFCVLFAVVVGVDIPTGPEQYVIIEDSLYFEIVWPESIMYTFKLKQARNFGADFDRVYNNIEMILGNPLEGCQELQNDVTGAVVFLIRGGCSFLTKTKVAENAGALAVIISDNDQTNDVNMVDMIDDSTERVARIPSSFLLGKDGFMIQRQLKAANSDHAIINIPVNLTGKPILSAKQPPWTLW